MRKGWRGAHLERVRGFAVLAPVVIHVEADEAEHGEVEEDFPAGDQPAVAVERVAEVRRQRGFLRGRRRGEECA